MWTNPEEDAIQIHTDNEISGGISGTQVGRSNRIAKKRIDTLAFFVLETFGVEMKTV